MQAVLSDELYEDGENRQGLAHYTGNFILNIDFNPGKPSLKTSNINSCYL